MAVSESSPASRLCRDLGAFTERDPRRTIVWLRGELDISTEAGLWDTLARAIALDDADLVVDLSAVRFMGAASVGVLIRVREILRLRSRSLVLRCPSKCTRRVLDLCGLGDLLDVSAVDAPGLTRTAGALASWVAVPATNRLDRSADASTSKSSVKDPVCADHITTVRTNVAGRGGP